MTTGRAALWIVMLSAAAAMVAGCAAGAANRETLSMAERAIRLEDQSLVVRTEYEDGFSRDTGNWLAEGTPRVGVAGGRLSIDAVLDESHVATVWCTREFEGDQVIEYTARIEPTVDASGNGETNLNFILFASDPTGTPLDQTSAKRTGAYKEYHLLNNYILTCLNSDRQGRSPIHGEHGPQLVRIRFRKDPGFALMSEDWREPPIEKGRDYHFTITVQGDRLRCYVDGRKIVDVTDGAYRRGWHGFRTWMSHVSAEDFRVSRIAG